MSFLSPPRAPDPTQTSNTQLGFNQQAAQAQQGINMVNQSNPFGSLTYNADPNSPGGYTANVSLSPEQQQLLNTQQATRQNFGNAAQALTATPGFGANPNIDPSSLTNKMMGWGQQYMQPIFDQQQSNLDAKLQNQGITPGSEAYNNAQNLQSRNVNNAYQSLFLNAEPTAFNQAIQEYQLPMQTAYSLMGAGAPVSPSSANPTFQNTPQEQIGAPNYQQAAQNQFQAQQSQYQNMMGGIGQLAGIAAAPFTAGLSTLPGMFGGGWGAQTGPTYANGNQGMMGGVPFNIY
jgi:hypothetical protein